MTTTDPGTDTGGHPALLTRRGSAQLALTVSAVIGLAIMGDSLLYSILPLEAERIGIPLSLVGILLGANRLIRLASNTWASIAFERWGPRWPFASATILAVLTSAVYATNWGFGAFLLARIGWGIAWSAFRQGGNQAIWAGDPTVRGRTIGLLWGIVRLGSALSVLAGGYLWDRFGYQASTVTIAAITCLSVPMALVIDWPAAAHHPPPAPQRAASQSQPPAGDPWAQPLLVAILLSAAFEGVVASTASLFLTSRLPWDSSLTRLGIGVGSAAGMILAVRWVARSVFGPILGALGDRWGLPRTVVLLTALLTATMGMAVLIPGWLALLGLSLTFILAAGVSVALGAIANHHALCRERPHLFLGACGTATDAGLAAGPILVYLLGGLSRLSALYVICAAACLLAVLRLRSLEAGLAIP